MNNPVVPDQSHPEKSKPASPSFVLMMLFGGVLIAVGAVSIYMPRIIAWYAEPPMPMGVTCTSSIRWALQKLQIAQMVAVVVGGVVGLGLGFRLGRRNS